MPLSVTKTAANTTIDVVDANTQRHTEIRALFEPFGFNVRAYTTAEAYLHESAPTVKGCLLCYLELLDITGIELLKQLQIEGRLLPTMMLVGNSNVPMAVSMVRAGAVDVIESTRIDRGLVQCVLHALKSYASVTETTK